MPKYRLTELAESDLRYYCQFIARDKPQAARRWAQRIREKCRLIARFPGAGESRPEYGTDIRVTTLGSYLIFYVPAERGVDIIRIIRGDRNIKSLD